MGALRYDLAFQVFEAFPDLHDEVEPPREDLASLAFIERLAASQTPENAVVFAAHACDRRRAVWWALQCVLKLGSPGCPEEEAAMKAAEAWVRDPVERRRLAAIQLGMEGNPEWPGTWVALAAGSSSGYVPVPGTDARPPVAPQMCAASIRTAILVAVAGIPIRERGGALTKCLHLFRDITK